MTAIVSIGEALVDLIAAGGQDLQFADTLQIREGGAPANVSVGLARLGQPAILSAVVGDDSFGERLLSRLEREGVNTGHVRVADSTPTTVAFAWQDQGGDGHFRLHRHADALLAPDDIPLDQAEALIVGSVSLCAEPSRTTVLGAVQDAHARGIPIVFDVNVRPGQIPMEDLRLAISAVLPAATVVKLSLDDAHHLWGSDSLPAVKESIAKFDIPIAVLTDGKRGAALVVDGTYSPQDAFSVVAVEPTGAGDAFTAAFVSRVRERGWKTAQPEDLRFAMAAGALATTRPGAWDGLPTADNIQRFLHANPA